MKKLKNQTTWIYVLTALALLPAICLRDFTPDNELRYLSIADEAIKNGSLFCFTNHGEIYADKPPLYMWIVMLGRQLCAQNCMWFIALFSLIPMLLCGKVMDKWAADARFTTSQRQLGLLMLFTCGFFPGLGVTLRMDMLMTLWILLALRKTYTMALSKPTRTGEALLGLYTFMALFTKGPLGVIIPLSGSLAWLISTRRTKMFRHIWGWPAWCVILAGCTLWFGGVYAEGGTEYLNNLLFHQTIDRSVNAFTHARPWWYYLAHMWYVMAPWSVLIAVLAGLQPRASFSGDFRRMMVAVFVTTLAVLSVISSKLQVYMLPAIPFAVYLGASLITGKTLANVVKTIACAILAIVFIASWFIPRFNPMIGYGTVCHTIASQHPSLVLVDTTVRRGENIDAYFHCPVETVAEGTSLSDYPAGTFLITQKENGLLYYECNR